MPTRPVPAASWPRRHRLGPSSTCLARRPTGTPTSTPTWTISTRCWPQAAQENGGIYFPLEPYASGEGFTWVPTTQLGDQTLTIRSGDGSHFTIRGYQMVADLVLDDLVRRFPSLAPAPEQLAFIALQ